MGWPWQRQKKQAKREPRLEPLSDRKYEQLFLALLEDVAEGKSPEQIQARLGDRRNDRSFVSWLRRYGQKLLQQPAENAALAPRMVELATAGLGELSVVSKEIGERLRTKAAESPPKTLTGDEPPKTEASDLPSAKPLAEGDSQADFYFQQGNDAYLRGNFRGAIKAYDQALSIKPDGYEALSNKGLSLDHLGRYEEAIKAYDQASLIKPDDHVALSNRGLLLDHLGRYEEAIKVYDQALSIKPKDYIVLSNKGLSLDHSGQYGEAIKAYDQALSIKPDDCETLVAKGVAYNNSERYFYALEIIKQALAIDNSKAHAFYVKGYALTRLNLYEEAIAAHDVALSIEPDHFNAWLDRGSAAGKSLQCNVPVAFSLPVALQDISLNQRGYEGQLACCTIGLNHVLKDKNPEGWGLLHYETGRAHYFHGRFLPQSHIYLSQAASSYQSALTTLTTFPARHLKVLAAAIRAYLGLGNLELVEQYREQGLEVLRKLLNNASTPSSKQRLERQFSSFSQLQVDSLIRETNPITALETAERYKNRTLTWILDIWQEQITSPSWANMQTLLTPGTATIYWHLSPDSLTTFILTADKNEPIARTQSTKELEPLLKKWNQQYQNYRGKGKAAEAHKDFDTWRTNLQGSLHELKTILKISELETHLQNVSQLLLIPHRDLHCLPLHALFSDSFTISHLPSLQVGRTLKQRAVSTTPRAELPLLTIADPSSDTPRLESAQIEAILISQLFEQVNTVKSNQATLPTVTAKLCQPNRIFNFSGHAWAERQPKHSALYLQGEDRLTAETICQLTTLKSYELITLSACETAVTGIQTIESDYVGLVSAFLTAGAANIISTLWTVESESNAWLMVTFYQHYVAGDSPAVALKKAQHWLRTLTYADLADWLQVQQNQLDSCIHPNAYDAIAARIGDIQSDPSKIESEKPYAEPYYWAAFTVTGYLS